MDIDNLFTGKYTLIQDIMRIINDNNVTKTKYINNILQNIINMCLMKYDTIDILDILIELPEYILREIRILPFYHCKKCESNKHLINLYLTWYIQLDNYYMINKMNMLYLNLFCNQCKKHWEKIAIFLKKYHGREISMS